MRVDGRRDIGLGYERMRSCLRVVAVAAVLYALTDLGVARRIPPVSLCLSYAFAVLLLAWLARKAIQGGTLLVCSLSGPMAVWVGAGVLATATSIDPRISVERFLWMAALAMLFFLICDLLDSTWRPATLITALLLFVGGILVKGMWGVATWHHGWWQVRLPEYPVFLVRLRLYGVADHPNLLAGLVNLALPFAILRLASSRGIVSRVAWSGWLLFADVILFYTRSRGGWLAACAVLIVTVGCLVWRQFRMPTASRRQRFVAIGTIALTVLAYIALFAALYALSELTSPSEYTRSGGSVSSGGGRFRFWQVALGAARSSPWVGVGLRTFSRVYVDAAALGRADGWVANHAHSLAINTLAEQGLVGIAALGWLCIAAALLWVRGLHRGLIWESENPGGPAPMVVGVGAALAGCFVHMQADVITELPTTAIVLVMLCAVLAHEGGYPAYRRVRFPRLAAVLPAVGILAGCVLLALHGRAHYVYLRGVVDALSGDWGSASQHVREAATLDPAFTFYQEQLAFAEGTALLAQTAPDESDVSGLVSRYRKVLTTQPTWVPNYLNAAWIALRVGNNDEASTLLSEAAQATDGWPIASLLLAERMWTDGAGDQASELLTRVLERDATAGELAACQASVICRRLAARVAVVNEPAAPRTVSARAMALTQQGMAADALDALAFVPLTSSHPRPWIERARAHLALGQIRQASYALRVVDALTTRSGFTQDDRHAAVVRAALLEEEGDLASATKALEGVVRPQLLVAPYHYVTFDRLGLPGLLLPGLADMASTEADVDASIALARLYAVQGRDEEAVWAWERAETLQALFGEPTMP